MISLRIISKSLSETHSIPANVEFPWLAGRFLPARHSGAAKICFIPGQITVYSTVHPHMGRSTLFRNGSIAN
jgi:hypothetical protein